MFVNLRVCFSCLLFCIASVSVTFGQKPDVITLLSAKQNVGFASRVISQQDIQGGGDVPWTVTTRLLHGGKQEGVELVTIDNGKIKITLIPTRGLNLLEVRDSRTNQRLLGWDSPVQGVVHPRHIDLESRGGLGWLEGFNEWMVRCGLEFAGHPGTDEFINNTGDTAEMDLTLHGKIGNIPASEVEVYRDGKSGRVVVRGIVYESFFYGPKLRLVAEVSTLPGSTSFQISDQITNLGASDQEFQLIYHANFGAPILEAGAKVTVAAKTVQPMNAHAAKATKSYQVYAGPTVGFVEEVYLVHPYGNDSGMTAAVLENRKGDLGAKMSWSLEQLPYLTIWKNTAAREDGYVTGIEPATGFPFNRMVERKFGRVPVLSPSQSRRFVLDIDLLMDRKSVETAVGVVQQIRGGRETTLVAEPPDTES